MAMNRHCQVSETGLNFRIWVQTSKAHQSLIKTIFFTNIAISKKHQDLC